MLKHTVKEMIYVSGLLSPPQLFLCDYKPTHTLFYVKLKATYELYLLQYWPCHIPSCLWVWWQGRPWLTVAAESKINRLQFITPTTVRHISHRYLTVEVNRQHSNSSAYNEHYSISSVWITMETGFQVVVGAALGCQLVPPVILFSPGWLQWMSLQIKTVDVSTSV